MINFCKYYEVFIIASCNEFIISGISRTWLLFIIIIIEKYTVSKYMADVFDIGQFGLQWLLAVVILWNIGSGLSSLNWRPQLTFEWHSKDHWRSQLIQKRRLVVIWINHTTQNIKHSPCNYFSAALWKHLRKNALDMNVIPICNSLK